MNAHSTLLFGANGYVGGTIATAARLEGHEIFDVHSYEFPFREDASVWPNKIQIPVETVILAANFEKLVTKERNTSEPVLLEKFTSLVELLSAQRIIFLSSDAVFNGQCGSYDETSAQTPITPYGRCKIAMESAIINHPRGHVVRMSVVWGSGAVKPDARREKYLRRIQAKNNNEHLFGSTNVFRSPIQVSRLAFAVVRMTREPVLPKILHLATPRMSYLDFLCHCILPDFPMRIDPWIDPKWENHDTSLTTTHQRLVDRLLKI